MKIKGPLLSIGASGSVGNVLTFSKRKTHQHARNKQGTNKKLTPAQAEWRLLFDFVSLKWQSLTDDEKNVYRALGKELNPSLTGFQYLAKIGLISPSEYLDLAFFCPLMYPTLANQFTNYGNQENNINITRYATDTFQIKKRTTSKNKYYFYRAKSQTELSIDQNIDLELDSNNTTLCFLYQSVVTINNNYNLFLTSTTLEHKGITLSQVDAQFLLLTIHGDTNIYKNVIKAPYDARNLNYVCIVFTSGTTLAYVNGKLSRTITPGQVDFDTVDSIFLQQFNWGSEGNIKIHNNYTILKRALSADEVMIMYKNQKLNLDSAL